MTRAMSELQRPLLDSENPGARRKQRGDLWYFEKTSAPRPDDICDRYVRRIAPWWGFAAYAVIYLFVALMTFTAGMFLGIGLGTALGAAKGSTSMFAFALVAGLAMFVLPWWHFARWMKRRRAEARPLVRDGKLVPGVVLDAFAGSALEVAGSVATNLALARFAGLKFYRVGIEHAGTQHVLKLPIARSAVPATDTPMTALFHSTMKYALVFDAAGKAQVATCG